jgi:hypothetical protein
MHRRVCSRGEGSVSDDCFGVCVAMERRFIDNTPLVEVSETTLAKLGIVAMGKIAA